MALLPILIAPDPRLKRKAAPVEQVDESIRRLMDDMLETMYDAPGIGLAAPQVGVSKRVLVVDVTVDETAPKHPICMANPEIIWASDDKRTYEEGCLSVPKNYANVIRPDRVKVRYLDRDGQSQELEADGLLATALQHEIDHLDGTLFIDYLSTLKRGMIIRKLQKSQKDGE